MAAKKSGFIFPEPKRTRARFRNPISKYRIAIGPQCDNCGICIDVCPHQVYTIGSRRPRILNEHFCLGPACEKNSFCCLSRCPKAAITLRPNPSFEVLGDRRWTAELLAGTWHMAETGETPPTDLNYKTGASGGGFDKLRLVYPQNKNRTRPEEISTAINLNRSGDNRPQITIPLPFYLGGGLPLLSAQDLGNIAREIEASSETAITNNLYSSDLVAFPPGRAIETVDLPAIDNPLAQALVRATRERGTLSIIGGGDTAGAIAHLGLSGQMTHVSTGGGASLECLSGLVLPGVAVLEREGG